ncbi:permease [Escherichia coli]|nr:permease [Escherichia coli]
MEKCDFYHIIVLSLNFPGYLKMEYGSTKMEERLSRSPGGKLALWAFYTWCGYFVWAMARYIWWCGYFVWAMARYIWVMSRIPDAPVSGFESDLGSTAGKWLGALVGFLFMALVGALLGSIAWYTRPRPARSRRYE